MESEQLFLIVWVLLAIGLLTFAFFKGKKMLSVFSPLDSVKVVFREKRVSGGSRKSFITKGGSASKVLDVVVTENELWIKCSVLMAGFSWAFDLVHKVDLSNITSVNINKNKVSLSFQSSKNESTVFDLKLKKAKEFFNLIESKKKEMVIRSFKSETIVAYYFKDQREIISEKLNLRRPTF